ncbi:MAG: hypothetical protein JWQ81_6204 [Amycolatopsis sp.]|jgi:hypothetical protein|uniref:hypothetical protein n=1 Tax=Amycolatopsis sp. TaxID=37632 RepID=UPI002618B58F|nr:hypothetical protein [Amycolatopsis sp.]MCU1685465.1 hypothetical protein [Amycolatopsis sp.]
MTIQRPRSGIFATVDGREYEASSYPHGDRITLVHRGEDPPLSELFSWNEAFGAWLAVVPVEHCETLVEITTNTTYLGMPCRIVAIDADGSVGLYYAGDEKSEAQKRGFTQIDVGTWAKTINVFDLSRYYEYRYDLLFPSRVGSDDSAASQ